MSDLDMNTLWSAGKVIHGYTMLGPAHEGSNSVWGKAKSPGGATVFFKKYTSPSSVFDDWYQGYVNYQEKIKSRIDGISAVDMQGRNLGPTYRFIEFFEEEDPTDHSPWYYQVLEYIDGAKDLETYLSAPETTWEDRKTFANVFMFAMQKLHDNASVIHTDLKPKNLLLIPTTNERGEKRYQLKVIDLDVSILVDEQAPWHGQGDGYIGSPGYYSPEHLRGEVPQKGSDVFTCGLILYEILAKGGHPYGKDEQVDLSVYEAYGAPVPELRGTYGSPEKDADIAQMLHRMLDPDPSKRPTAHEVHQLLVQRARRPVAPPPRSTVTPPPRSTVTPPPRSTVTPPPQRPVAPVSPQPPTTPLPQPSPVVRPQAYAWCRLKLSGGTEAVRVFNGTVVGYKFLESLSSEARKYYSREHFVISYRSGKWYVRHCAPRGENKTTLNGVLLTGEMELHDGDRLAAASQDGSKSVLPLCVEIGG